MSEYRIVRDTAEIDAQLDLLWEFRNVGRYSGMSYEDGAQYMFDWLVGNEDEPPFNTEDLA